MRVELRLGGLISIRDEEIALGQTHALLDGIAQERSIRGAAERLGLSYRSAWGKVLKLESALGQPVAVKTKGHGSALTGAGAALRDALAQTIQSFDTALASEERALAGRLAVLVGDAPPRERWALSNDPLLMSVLGAMSSVEAAVVGSREAVERLLAGRADVAGFHAGELDIRRTPPFDSLFKDRGYLVLPVFSREQGLMLARDNPLAIRGVDDLPRTGARYVNRQRGSGTRHWFDRLLAQTGIAAQSIAGYDQEEFTHQAVAAVIASGAADAGMGVRAVAERFGLAFVTVGTEIYHLAARLELAETVELVSERVAARLTEFPGYAEASRDASK
jgi:molybdate transport repressor ModE-like protein